MAQVDRASSDERGWNRFAVSAFGSVPPPMLVVLGIISLQVGAAFAKQIFALAGASGMVTLRLAFATLVLLLVWRPSLRMNRRTALVVLGYGVVLGGMNMSLYQALERIPLGVAVTIEFLGPLSVAVLGSRRKTDVVWAVLAGLGVLLLSQGGGQLDPVGIAFALLAACCWACYILMGAKLGDHTSGGSGLALGMLVATAVVVPFGVTEAGAVLLRPEVLAVGLVVALMSSVIPYSLELEALRRIPQRVFGVLMSLEPAVAALAGLLVLREALGAVQWLAICCVVVASVGATRSSRTEVDSSDRA
ncbi:inner membrane transporter RhtA [Saccharopolyspora lacisalsi]|uniref:Inner membrane transporter RhtA n=1 Tax=Halosaccharopolyspora lacisalsi TaxID=1000566 RepID=A0A839DZN7_9PSEU|nr:DMT family transporter [Halosaccharopolyspora lacisalsi]MBA8825716.1 inner membrane transporter RhtA [Halosaccharopolyspora lacisalsi]